MTWLDDVSFGTVIAHTTDAPSLKGNVAAIYDDCVVLRDATLLDGDTHQMLQGDLVVPRERVWCIQKVEG